MKVDLLSIHKTLPFFVKHSEGNGMNLCTLKKEDLEAFLETHYKLGRNYRIAKALLVICICIVIKILWE